MKHGLILLALPHVFTKQIKAQEVSNEYVLRYYDCCAENDSIPFSIDFQGPKYFNYYEGVIASFWTNDTCILQILCGGNMEIELDSTYLLLESQVDCYYSAKLRKYA